MTEQEKVVTDISDMDNFDLFNNSKEWNRFYKRKKKSSAVEWYLSWDELSPDIMPNLEILQSPNILVPACGNSRLSEQLYSSGFHNITSVDYSSELIKTMKNQHREKVGMQWLTKDVLAPLQESPILIPRSYDVILDKGCFDCLCLWAHHMNKGDKCLDQYLHNVKDLLGFRGKFIILTKLYWDNTLAFLYHRFWLGWKLTLQRVFPQKDDDEMAVMFVIEKCTNGLIYNIIQDDKSHKTLSAEVDQENKSIDNYRKRAKSKEDFELSLRGKGVESCCEVDDGDYRIIVLIDSNKFHDLKKVDVLWVPEDDLVLHSDALTNSKYWQLEHFFSTVTRASALLFIVLSPKLQLHLQSDTQMDKIRLDLKPLLETIDPKIQVGWLKMWNKEHQKKLTDIGFLPTPPSSKPTPQSSKPTLRSSKSSKKGSKESGTSKGKEKLEKDDNSFGKDLNEESIVVVGDLDKVDEVVDKVDEVVDKVLDEVLDEKVDLIEQTSTGGMPLLLLDFPIFHDGDAISYYSKPFTLASWLKDHEKKEDRCLGVYLGWKDILPQVDCPNLLKRECLRIMQSIVLGVLDYHEKYGAHDGLHDWTNILITQVVINHIGSKMVRFETKLSFRDRVTFDDSVMILKKQGDMQNVLLIMEKLLEGVTKNSELKYLGDLLFHYPYEEGHFWKTLLLKNYPAFWDGLERAEFLVTLYFHLVSKPKSSYSLKWSLGLSRQYLHGWMSLIPPDTIFEKILCGDDLDEDQCRVKKYTEGDITEVVRYMRATVHHFRENGGADLDLRYIEAALSHLFENYIMEIYSSMCRNKMFLL